MIIDIHTHAWPEKVSQKARESLESFFKIKLVGDPTVTTLERCMKKNSIDVSVVCAVASRPEQVKSINDWAFSIRSGRIKVFASFHPGYESWKDELARIKKNADGIKLQPEFQDFYVDDEMVFPAYEEMERLGLPVLFHCGEELSGTMLVRSSAKRIWNVKRRFKKLNIIAAHFGGFRLWDEVKEFLLGKDIYLDTAFFFQHLPVGEIIEMIKAHPAERILFGTDFPLVDQADDIRFLRGLDISPEAKGKIFGANAARLLNLKLE